MVWQEWDLNPASAVQNLVCPYQGKKERRSVNHLSSWNLISECRQSKVWIKRPCLKLARFFRNLPITKLGVLFGLLTGHDRLNKHLHRMG
jgi:hypothetical protein